MLPKTTLLVAALLLTIFFSKAHACCSPSNFPGCGNSTIENFVCTNYDVACCQTKWGADCAELVHFAKLLIECAPVCGDGFCVVGETCSNCPSDCGACDKSSCSVAFNESTDPLASQQWHIKNAGKNGGKAGNDANVLPVWRKGVYGSGVKIAIVDDGVQWTHPEIQCNYDADISYDFDQGNTDASPQFLDYHGTACAGVAAARDNNKCGRGVAFRATIGGIRVLGENFRDSVAASALSFKNQEIDIYSNSWGPNDDGKTVDEFPKTLAAIANGVQTGRSGKGNIFVWAAGNGKMNGDNSNYDALANSPYTITVSATDYNGVASIYSEAGSNILVNAPSNNYVLQSNNAYKPISGIATSDLSGFRGYSNDECTSNFGGTSSSAPLVAGVIAQMLEVNSNLTWRDVQHILVETATQNDVNNTEWVQNAAGARFNPNYGFGRVNAEAAVAAAAAWTGVCNNMIELKQHVDINAAIPQSSADPLIVPITVYQDIIVEHVVVKINSDHASRGQVVFAISSPQDTTSVLSTGRRADVGTEYKDTPFSTVQFWGEASKGTWNFAIFDATKDTRTGSVNYIDISIFGYRTNCSDISEPKDPEFRDRPVDEEEKKPAPTFDLYAIGSIILASIVGVVALVIGGIVFVKLFVTEVSQYSSFKSLFE